MGNPHKHHYETDKLFLQDINKKLSTIQVKLRTNLSQSKISLNFGLRQLNNLEFFLTLEMKMPGSRTSNGRQEWSTPPTMLNPSGPPAFTIAIC